MDWLHNGRVLVSFREIGRMLDRYGEIGRILDRYGEILDKVWEILEDFDKFQRDWRNMG